MNETFFNIFRVKELRDKILFILALLVVYRLAANIPLPGVDVLALKRLFDQNAFLGLLNVFSGGGLSNISIVLLGVAPYITAHGRRNSPKYRCARRTACITRRRSGLRKGCGAVGSPGATSGAVGSATLIAGALVG